jgi:tRNA (cmo5U34)-methyltransferase
MNSDEWPAEMAGPAQAVVSARAIHHLTDSGKGVIFGRICDVLAPGGVFVNWDLFREPSEPQKESHPVATVDVQLELMRAAGFTSVGCHHEIGRRKVFFGKKPS